MTSPYVTGTVSVTAGSAVVTGTGTAWATALVAGGLFGLDSSNGNPVPILSVDGNTQLTLAKPWRGTTAAGQGYWIVRDTAYLQQQTVNAQALSTYIQRLDNAALTALAGLDPSADKFAYFTGANSGALADIKAKGRDIMSAADMLGLLGKLGPVFGGPPPSPTGANVGLSEGDFNTINVPGVYSIAGTWANGPTGTATWTAILEVRGRNGSNLYYQTLYHSLFGVFERWTQETGGLTWPNAWYSKPRGIVGGVAQSSGMPTGSILERGNNANGDYIRFADGTQICWADVVCSFGIAAALLGTWTFPITFSGGFPRMVSVTSDWSTTGGAMTASGYQTYGGGALASASATTAQVRIGRVSGANFAAGDSVNTKCIALGRWF